jgi:hypothetical protein
VSKRCTQGQGAARFWHRPQEMPGALPSSQRSFPVRAGGARRLDGTHAAEAQAVFAVLQGAAMTACLVRWGGSSPPPASRWA